VVDGAVRVVRDGAPLPWRVEIIGGASASLDAGTADWAG
jgi:alpha-D-xyloside xylohydrolase